MIYLTKNQQRRLIEHAKREAPNEACGILAGKEGKVDRIYVMPNTEKSPERFFMEPKEQLRVTKEIRGLNLEMVGIYHSHTHTQAFPSANDVELAFYPDASYLIVSIAKTDKPSLRSFKIVEGRITEEKVIIE